MSYIQDSLGANETVHYVGHFPVIDYVMAYGALIVAAVLGIWSNGADYPILAMVAVAIGVIVYLMIMIPIWTTEIGVTNQRVILKRGFISRQTMELQLRSIEEVSVDQGVLGRIFGFGKINISGTGEDQIDLPSIGEPLLLRKHLQEAIGAIQHATTPVSSTASA